MHLPHRFPFATAVALLAATMLFAACANDAAGVEVTSSASSLQVTKTEASAPTFSAEALGKPPAEVAPQPAASATPEAAAPSGTAAASGSSAVQADVRSSGSTVMSGAGDVVVRARSSVNGTAYEVLCTRTGGGGQASSVAVRQQTATENGVVKARVVLSTNGTEYPVVVDGVTNASALAALNASLTNVSCTVSA